MSIPHSTCQLLAAITAHCLVGVCAHANVFAGCCSCMVACLAAAWRHCHQDTVPQHCRLMLWSIVSLNHNKGGGTPVVSSLLSNHDACIVRLVCSMRIVFHVLAGLCYCGCHGLKGCGSYLMLMSAAGPLHGPTGTVCIRSVVAGRRREMFQSLCLVAVSLISRLGSATTAANSLYCLLLGRCIDPGRGVLAGKPMDGYIPSQVVSAAGQG